MARDINLYAMIGDVMIYIGVTMLVTKIPVVQIWLLLLPTLAIALLWTLAFISVGILSMRFWTGATIGSIVSPGTLQSYSIHFGQKFPT